MKKHVFMIITFVILLGSLNAQSKVYSEEDLKKSKEILLFSNSDKDYFGTVRNGEVISAYSKNRKTGAKEEISYNGTSPDGKIKEKSNELPTGTMAKANDSTSAPEKKCKKYTLYDCEIIITREDGSTYTKPGQCVRQEDVECPTTKVKKNSEAIKSPNTNTTIKSH